MRLKSTESLEAYLARGGTVRKLDKIAVERRYDSRFSRRETAANEGYAERTENLCKSAGKKFVPKHTQMYLKFRKAWGL